MNCRKTLRGEKIKLDLNLRKKPGWRISTCRNSFMKPKENSSMKKFFVVKSSLKKSSHMMFTRLKIVIGVIWLPPAVWQPTARYDHFSSAFLYFSTTSITPLTSDLTVVQLELSSSLM